MREWIYEEIKGLEQKELFGEWKVRLGKQMGMLCRWGMLTVSRLGEGVTAEDVTMVQTEMGPRPHRWE